MKGSLSAILAFYSLFLNNFFNISALILLTAGRKWGYNQEN
jgi:hypothetical protein